MGGSYREGIKPTVKAALNLAWSPKQDLIKLILHTPVHPQAPFPGGFFLFLAWFTL